MFNQYLTDNSCVSFYQALVSNYQELVSVNW